MNPLVKNILEKKREELGPIEPIGSVDKADNTYFNQGLSLLSSGQVAAILIAGGQGTRLEFKGPKGCFPISTIKNKSLFQLFAEKTVAASQLCNTPLKIAIMTSLQNHEETLLFFKEHANFGLKEEQLFFFTQGEFPMATKEGELFQNEKGSVAMGPDGNGVLFYHFVESGLYNDFKKAGITDINIVLVDNPMADPFDATLIGYHHAKKNDVTVKCVERATPQESVGLILKENGHIRVVEYSELTDNFRHDSRFTLANISLFAVSMPFIEKAAQSYEKLPWHAHLKKTEGILPGKSHIETFEAWKFEKFIFDNLQFADRVLPLLYPRDQVFAPLKRKKGEGSIEEVKRLLQNRDRAILKEITGIEPPPIPFELAQTFYYPTELLKEKWRGKTLNFGDYIE